MWRQFIRSGAWVTILSLGGLIFKPQNVQDVTLVNPAWNEPKYSRAKPAHVEVKVENQHMAESNQAVVASGEANELPPGTVLMPQGVRSYAARFPFKDASWVTNTATTRLEG